jgi:hypothetical protein
MSEEELEALERIRDLVDRGQYRLTIHFRQRLAQRGVFWHDIIGILEEPDHIRGDGVDDEGGERWFISGSTDEGDAEFLVVVDVDAKFVTIYWN